jgi:hypothetical protein
LAAPRTPTPELLSKANYFYRGDWSPAVDDQASIASRFTPRLSERIVESLAWCDANSPAFHIFATFLVTSSSDCTKRRKSSSKKEGECCIIPGHLQLSMGYAQLFFMTPDCFHRPIHRRMVLWSTGLRSSNFWAQLDSLGGPGKMRTGPRDQPVSGLPRFAELPRIMGRAFQLPWVSLADGLAQFLPGVKKKKSLSPRREDAKEFCPERTTGLRSQATGLNKDLRQPSERLWA